jgi:hypothetical protein
MLYGSRTTGYMGRASQLYRCRDLHLAVAPRWFVAHSFHPRWFVAPIAVKSTTHIHHIRGMTTTTHNLGLSRPMHHDRIWESDPYSVTTTIIVTWRPRSNVHGNTAPRLRCYWTGCGHLRTTTTPLKYHEPYNMTTTPPTNWASHSPVNGTVLI